MTARTVGCVDCLDGSPTHYAVDAVTAAGFAGRWANYQTSIAVAVDRRGRELPGPSGYFCARRVRP